MTNPPNAEPGAGDGRTGFGVFRRSPGELFVKCQNLPQELPVLLGHMPLTGHQPLDCIVRQFVQSLPSLPAGGLRPVAVFQRRMLGVHQRIACRTLIAAPTSNSTDADISQHDTVPAGELPQPVDEAWGRRFDWLVS